MAHKLQLLKLLQEIRGFADAGNRSMELRPLLPPSAQLRSGTEPTTLPVRRFSIPVCHEHHPDAPSEIPITRTNDLASHADRVTRISLRPS